MAPNNNSAVATLSLSSATVAAGGYLVYRVDAAGYDAIPGNIFFPFPPIAPPRPPAPRPPCVAYHPILTELYAPAPAVSAHPY